MALTGQQYRVFMEALLAAFPQRARLEEVLKFYVDRMLDQISDSGSIRTDVFEVIKAANAEGWVLDLLDAARTANPRSPEIIAFAEQFGAAPEVTLIKQSREVVPSAKGATLEREIRAALGQVDVMKWRTRLGELETQVCRIEVPGPARSEFGTGFLVGPDVLLTNYHVIEPIVSGKADRKETILRFDYKRLADGVSLNQGTTYRLLDDDPGWLIDSSKWSDVDVEEDPQGLPKPEELDYALLRVDGAPGNDPVGGPENPDPNAPQRRWIPVPKAQHDFKANPVLFILQHPNAEPLKLAFDTDAIIGVNENDTRVRYRTNTESGSSGSPCFNANWEWVALHHAGDPAWIPRFNEGIPLPAILKLLEARGKREELAPLP